MSNELQSMREVGMQSSASVIEAGRHNAQIKENAEQKEFAKQTEFTQWGASLMQLYEMGRETTKGPGHHGVVGEDGPVVVTFDWVKSPNQDRQPEISVRAVRKEEGQPEEVVASGIVLMGPNKLRVLGDTPDKDIHYLHNKVNFGLRKDGPLFTKMLPVVVEATASSL